MFQITLECQLNPPCRYVQQKTNSPVDMRVGIHTGAILAGILGQRQWQYDVYSRDVELANKMESSGKAGLVDGILKSARLSNFNYRVPSFSYLFNSRVHISEKTLSFLHGEFEVEPAFGEKREESLRIAGLKTYFITKVLKPVSLCCLLLIHSFQYTSKAGRERSPHL